MYQGHIELTKQDILEKEFKIDARGYRLQEVDKFLDIIIRDYNEYDNIISALENDKRQLANENQELCIKLGIKGAPTLLVPTNGHYVAYSNASEIKGFAENLVK